MNRRHWMMAGAGAAAAAAGVAWRLHSGSAGFAAAGKAQLTPAEAAFWEMSFPTPDGGTVSTASLRGPALLLNFWGTWCPPCIKEMPELDAFAREQASRGWRVLGLAVDNPKAVREYLARSPVSYTIALAGFEGTELAKQLGNDQSGLPFTVAFGQDGAVTHRKAGATTLEELRNWAQKP